MATIFEKATSLAVALSALSVAAVVVYREFSGNVTRAASQTASSRREPTITSGWDSILAVGVEVGPNKKVTLVEFVDFECPVCREFAGVVAEARLALEDTLGVVFVHYPLSRHRFARPAARAAECAARFDSFSQFHDLLFEKQDSLGLKSWPSYANEAGIVDTVAFGVCLKEKEEPPRIMAGVAQGKRIGVLGTPTVLINGWRFWSTPTADELKVAVRRLAKGLSPTEGGSSPVALSPRN